MYKMVITGVIALGKTEEDKAFRERELKIFKKYGVSYKMWRVEGRKFGQVFQEFGEFKSRAEADAAIAKLTADKEWQDLFRELSESGRLVPGTTEVFLLADY
jgi:hypothetical protein